jgi:ubiquinone/menaquinone biosynthesis C-methylase UbiE
VTATMVNHPLFAHCWNRVSSLIERDAARHRREMLAGARGRVVEIGAGNGMNFRHYPTIVDEVVALEPEPYLRARAQDAARESPLPVSVRDGVADELPLEDGCCDTAIASLVLCSVPNPPRALAELRRVLRPGGQLRFFEHVRSDNPAKARVQTWLDRSGVWSRLGGGCHCARDTVDAIKAAGFRVERLEHVTVGPALGPTNPYVVGVAT